MKIEGTQKATASTLKWLSIERPIPSSSGDCLWHLFSEILSHVSSGIREDIWSGTQIIPRNHHDFDDRFAQGFRGTIWNVFPEKTLPKTLEQQYFVHITTRKSADPKSSMTVTLHSQESSILKSLRFNLDQVDKPDWEDGLFPSANSLWWVKYSEKTNSNLNRKPFMIEMVACVCTDQFVFQKSPAR
jgi:hypothetical protein